MNNFGHLKYINLILVIKDVDRSIALFVLLKIYETCTY